MNDMDFYSEEPAVLCGDARGLPTDASRILEIQKLHRALARKNRKIDGLRARVLALENTVRMQQEVTPPEDFTINPLFCW